MPIFITQGRYTEHALKGMMASPEDRVKPLADLFERAGGKLLAFYLTFGEYDWISIADMPDHRSDLAVLIAGASNGAVTDADDGRGDARGFHGGLRRRGQARRGVQACRRVD